jgi:hypothetical protein
MKMKSKLEGGALLLAIALSGEVAAQTKDASQDPYIASNVRGFESTSGTGKPIEQLPPY